jgi:NTE family protein
MTDQNTHSHADKITALVLQGGGALGAYQLGAFDFMSESGYSPDVVAGISIGAMNAALIVGNKPEDRIERMEAFWKAITRPDPFMLTTSPELFGGMFHLAGVWQAFMFGQPNFFQPRMIAPWFSSPGTPSATSFYDTSPLRKTLLEFVDFDLINSKQTRLFLGAVKVKTGELVFFDNFKDEITPDHIIASGALPPGFPGVRIDGELYWDGGCVSNTPIDVVLENYPDHTKRIFVPELFAGYGKEPQTMNEVMVRLKAIQYASHSQYIERTCEAYNKDVEAFQRESRFHQQEIELYELKKKLSGKGTSDDKGTCCQIHRPSETHPLKAPSQLDVIRVVYQAESFETIWMDTDFSPASIKRRVEAGYNAMMKAIAQRPWGTNHEGARTHMVSNGRISRG